MYSLWLRDVVRRCGLQWNTSRLSKLRLNLHCSRWWPLCSRQWVKRGVTESLEGAAHPIMQCPVTPITARHQKTTGSAKITVFMNIYICAELNFRVCFQTKWETTLLRERNAKAVCSLLLHVSDLRSRRHICSLHNTPFPSAGNLFETEFPHRLARGSKVRGSSLVPKPPLIV